MLVSFVLAQDTTASLWGGTYNFRSEGGDRVSFSQGLLTVNGDTYGVYAKHNSYGTYYKGADRGIVLTFYSTCEGELRISSLGGYRKIYLTGVGAMCREFLRLKYEKK